MPWYMNLAFTLPSIMGDVLALIDTVVVDEKANVNEAEEAARMLSADLGDVMRITVNGTDIIGKNAQADLFAFLARCSARAYNARKN